MIDITPTTHLLNSIRNQNLGWTKAIAELIDNAFDALAMRVVIEARKRELTISDDGKGMVDVSSAVRLGDHKSSGGLGMYGIGLKDAWLYADGKIEVVTVHGGARSRIAADIQEMIERGDWSVDDPITEPGVDAPSGTVVKLVVAGRRKLPERSHMQQLAWIFTPALKDGKQVVWRSGKNVETLSAKELPPMNDTVRDEFEISGKKVSIEIGIVQDGYQMLNGPFWVQYGHRNIMKSHIGVGSYSDERMGGIIKLGSGWSLTKNKDDFDASKDDLADAIYDRIKFLLAKSEQLTQDIESRALMNELEKSINDALGELKREKRNQTRNTAGSIAPRNTGKRRRRASKTSELEGGIVADKGQRRRGITLGFNYLDGDTIGEYDSSSRRITLNASHPFISSLRSAKDKNALHCLAMSVFANYVCNHDGMHLTLFEVQDFSQTLGAIMRPMSLQGASSGEAI